MVCQGYIRAGQQPLKSSVSTLPLISGWLPVWVHCFVCIPRRFQLIKGIQRFYRESAPWKQLQHPNILLLIGVNLECDLVIVSEWMVYGNIMEFRKKYKGVVMIFMGYKAYNTCKLSNLHNGGSGMKIAQGLLSHIQCGQTECISSGFLLSAHIIDIQN